MPLKMFLTDYAEGTSIDSAEPRAVSTDEVLRWMQIVLREPDNFLGITDVNDTTLQFMVNVDRSIHVDVPIVAKGGSYAKTATLNECFGMVKGIGDTIALERIDGLEFQAWGAISGTSQIAEYDPAPVSTDDDTTEHDPFNDPEVAHMRARELMVEPLFWDCADEGTPFGSDEGWTAYYEWRRWRQENGSAPLTACFDWILGGRLNEYTNGLTQDAQIEIDLANPSAAVHGDYGDMWTLDTTIIASGLGQLMDEGVIDAEAKPFLRVAIDRQRNPRAASTYDSSTLDAIRRVVDAA